MPSFIELLNKILDAVMMLVRLKKKKELTDEYKNINDDLEGYITGDFSDGNTGVFTPDGEGIKGFDLREDAKPKS